MMTLHRFGSGPRHQEKCFIPCCHPHPIALIGCRLVRFGTLGEGTVLDSINLHQPQRISIEPDDSLHASEFA